MPNPHGTPIWYELLTDDHDASKTFYDHVIGWTLGGKPESSPMDYRMIETADGSMVGGVMQLSDAMKANGGVQIHVTNADAFRPYRTGVAFLKACHDQAPDRFQWRVKAYEFVDKIPAIDLLCGTAAVREGIEAGASIDDLAARWPRDEGAFLDEREPYLLYP